MPSGVLFVHSNFPAQFADLATALVARGVPCAAVGSSNCPGLPGVKVARWSNQKGTTPGIFPLATRAEADFIRGHAAMQAAETLKAEGFDPALIIGHPGWGETVFLADVWPDAKRILFGEFFYKGRGADIDFDTEFLEATPEKILAGRAKNAVLSLAYAEADMIVAPTEHQAAALPPVFRSRIRVIHEGIDTDAVRPGPARPYAIPGGPTLDGTRPVITHVNRHLEPLRGLHIFLRSLPKALAAVPEAQVVIVGSEDASGYSGQAPDGVTWKKIAMSGLGDSLDTSRVHFVGRLPHEEMLNVLRLSWAHVYYTYPFVLSWSLVEAMASGCYVIGSDTAPVRDAIQDGVNGKLLDFFDVDGLSNALIEACRNREAFARLRRAARQTAVARFDRTTGRNDWLELIEEVAPGVLG